jgi:Asp/Glu/hydantoin racemase
MPRIALIHATPAAIDPIVAEFASAWPDAELVNILDDSLSKDRARDGALTPAMMRRFDELSDYALSIGTTAILFTCSAFGPAIEQVARRLPVPVLKPNEAMFTEALATGRRIAMLATFEPSIPSMEEEFGADARRAGVPAALRSTLVPGAMAALQAGRRDEHNDRIVAAGRALVDCDAIMLAQFSMAPAAAALRQVVSVPVLTSPSSAVATLKSKMAAAA